jgi:hypothetical protein
MKKFIVVGLIGLMVMAFSATVYAQPKLEFRASGAMEATSFWHMNVAPGDGSVVTHWAGFAGGPFAPAGGYRPSQDPGWIRESTGAWDRPQGFMQYRAILRFDAIMGKELSGTFVFEMDSARWGTGVATWRADQTLVEIKNLYIDVGLPYFGIPVPMTARIGIQPIGMRPHIFNIVDGAGITGGLKIDPVTIGLYWAKALEGKDATSDDVDMYALSVQAKLGTITAGAYWFYYNMNTYPLSRVQANYGTTGAGQNEADFHWLGIFADGKLGPVNLNFDFVYDTGTVEGRKNSVGILAENKVKYRGFATQLKVDFPWEKFNFGLLGMYASGADRNKTSEHGLPGQFTDIGTLTTKVGSYVVPPGSEEWAAWGESMILGSNFITGTALPQGMWPALAQTGAAAGYGNQVTRGAIGGTWVAKLYASVKATPWYKVTLQGLYIGDTTKHGNTLSQGRKWGGELRDDKTIGWEFDLINEIQIYKNLKWSIGAGILFAGDALRQEGSGVAKPSYAPKDPWIVATKLRYDF